MPQKPPDAFEHELTDLHAVRLILRDLIYLLLTETNIDSTNRQTLSAHLEALDDMIGDDDVEDPEAQ